MVINFNTGGSGGGVTEERVKELIAEYGAPIAVKYTDIDTELGLEIYANPEKYVIESSDSFYFYNRFTVNGVIFTHFTINANNEHSGKDGERYTIMINKNGEKSNSDDDLKFSTEIEYSGITEDVGIFIYRYPQKYVIKDGNEIYHYAYKTNSAVSYFYMELVDLEDGTFGFDKNEIVVFTNGSKQKFTSRELAYTKQGAEDTFVKSTSAREIWVGSRVDYENMPSHDPNTLYVITEEINNTTE